MHNGIAKVHGLRCFVVNIDGEEHGTANNNNYIVHQFFIFNRFPYMLKQYHKVHTEIDTE